MDVRAVDVSATAGSSALHRASPAAKLLAAGLLLGSVVVEQNVLVVAGILIVLAAAAIAARLPLRGVFGLAAYPGLFAIVFAFAAAPDALTGALFVTRAIAAALIAVILVFTTPYPQIFAPLQRLVPELVGDAMLMTYRSLFLLAEKFGHLLTAVRLRAGVSAGHPIRGARASASALGGLVLYALDLSQREYDVMHLRGYEGRVRISPAHGAGPAIDAAVAFAAIAVLAVALVFRLTGSQLTPLSWLPAAGACFILLGTLVWRSIAR